jgi:hypothetical protein
MDYELSYSNGQAKAARASAARIDIEHSVATLDGWLVRVTGDNNMNACRRGLDVKLREIVNCVDACAFELEQLGLSQSISPGTSVIVATNGRDGRNGGELAEYLSSADIAAVDDEVAAMQER